MAVRGCGLGTAGKLQRPGCGCVRPGSPARHLELITSGNGDLLGNCSPPAVVQANKTLAGTRAAALVSLMTSWMAPEAELAVQVVVSTWVSVAPVP